MQYFLDVSDIMISNCISDKGYEVPKSILLASVIDLLSRTGIVGKLRGSLSGILYPGFVASCDELGFSAESGFTKSQILLFVARVREKEI